MRAFIVHSAKACPEREPAVAALQSELERTFPTATVDVLTGHEPGSCSPEHARSWCSGGSLEAVSRLLKHVDALNAAAAYEGRTLVLEDDIQIDNAAALVAAVEGTGIVQLATSASAYCLDAQAASKIMVIIRMTPRPADFAACWKEALEWSGVASRHVAACSDGSTVGHHTPSVRSGKTLVQDFLGSTSTLVETERLLNMFPRHPYASLVHAAKLQESRDFMGALKVCRAALDTFRTKPDGSGDTPLVRFTVALFESGEDLRSR
jgi:hypothetical protein